MGQKVVQKIGKYEILSELGQGGMGVVYKARDPLISRLVALKTVNPELVSDPEILQRFYREAQSAGGLHHPNIVTVFDLGEFEGHPYIAMEFVEGESLQSMIARKAKIPLAAKLKLAEQVCSGLDHAHKNGIVHRDVKPGNILVKNDGTVKVVDFGIVKLESTTLTKTGMFMGTIQYASPEQLNEGKVDARSDLWSVVCVIYELIANAKPFDGTNFALMVGKILNSDPEPLSVKCPGVPVELDKIITKGLKKKVDERYQSLDELLADLMPIAHSLQRSLIADLLVEARELKDKGELNSAQEKVRAVLLLDKAQTDAKHLSGAITAELHRLASQPKVREQVTEGEAAYKRGDYAAAIKALTAALELNPNDTQVRELRDQAQRELDKLLQVREFLTAGQKAMKQGDLTGAEVELQKVIALDENNAQANTLLSEIRQDRLSREKDFRSKEEIWKADKLIAEGKERDAQAGLVAFLKEFPDAEDARRKLDELNNRLAKAPVAAFPASGSQEEKSKWRDSRLDEASQSLAADNLPYATLVISNLKDRFPTDPQVKSLSEKVEQKKTQTAAHPIQPTPTAKLPAVEPKRSMGLIVGGIALAVVLSIGGFFYMHRPHPVASGPMAATPDAVQLEHDAKLLQAFNRDAALDKWQKLAAMPGPLQDEAKEAVANITHQQDIEKQEKDVFQQGVTAQQAKQWDEAVGFYQKVADMNGAMKAQALQAMDTVKALQSGQNLSGLEKENFKRAEAAFQQQDYARAKILYQQVIDMNVPGSTLVPKAQAQLDVVKGALQASQEFSAADAAQNSGDLPGALQRFQDIASKPGPLQAQAQTRIQQINQIVSAGQQKQQAEKALQDNVKKFHDLEGQKKYADAAALLPVIGQIGGDANSLKTELEAAEQADLQNDINQFNQAKNNKDVGALQQIKGQFQNIAYASGAPAAQARDYAENQIPSLIAQINQANQPKPQAQAASPPAAPAHPPQVTLLASGSYTPWSRSVQRGMLVPDYNVEGGLKPLDLSMAPVTGAPAGSIVTVKINVDENGGVTPDHVLLDQGGEGPAVTTAAKKWKFNPPVVKGTPVRTSVTVKVTF